MITVDKALATIARHTEAPLSVRVKLDPAVLGSVLAEDVVAVESVPAYRASIVDGYAIHVDEHSTKGVFPVSAVSHAAPGKPMTLEPNQIARITTGAPLPDGANAVVMVEDTVLISKTPDGREELQVEILTDAVVVRENVRDIGSDVMAGQVVMRRGETISASGGEFGLLASCGVREVCVYKRPKVALLSTGDEVVPYDRPRSLRPGEVRDTNQPTLAIAIQHSGFDVIELGTAPDR